MSQLKLDQLKLGQLKLGQLKPGHLKVLRRETFVHLKHKKELIISFFQLFIDQDHLSIK